MTSLHAGRWERRGEIAHDRTAERGEAWRAHRKAVAAAEADEAEASGRGVGGPYERAPKSMDAGAGAVGNPYRSKPVDFIGFDGAMEPVRMPFRRQKPLGRRETEVGLYKSNPVVDP